MKGERRYRPSGAIQCQADRAGRTFSREVRRGGFFPPGRTSGRHNGSVKVTARKRAASARAREACLCFVVRNKQGGERRQTVKGGVFSPDLADTNEPTPQHNRSTRHSVTQRGAVRAKGRRRSKPKGSAFKAASSGGFCSFPAAGLR